MAEMPLHRYRSHTCGALRKADVGRPARLSGWVHRVRDHGGLLFIDLRDHYGLTQSWSIRTARPSRRPRSVRAEWVMRVDGTVRERPAGTVNPDLPTGEMELFAAEIEVLSAAKELPVAGVRRARLSGRHCGCNTASSTCAARPCTPTS